MTQQRMPVSVAAAPVATHLLVMEHLGRVTKFLRIPQHSGPLICAVAHLELAMSQQPGIMRHFALLHNGLELGGHVGRHEEDRCVAAGHDAVCFGRAIPHAVQHRLDPASGHASLYQKP